jgi:hypothetical protein
MHMKPIREFLHFQLPIGKYGTTCFDTVSRSAPQAHLSSQGYINRLSVEILASIFVRCLQFAGDNPFIIPKVTPSHAPLLLCQICGYWRKVALATPDLWAAISIDCAAIHQTLVSLWISRSRPLPLSFRISSSRFSKKSEKAIFAMFLENIDRWQDVHLKLDKYLCKMFLIIPPEQLSTARHLGLDARGCPNEQYAQILSVTRSFPNLRRLTFLDPFSRFSNSVPILMMDLSCSQLTYIRIISGLSMYHCGEILSTCRLAVYCQFSGIYGASKPIAQCNILLPYLKSLTLDSFTNTCDLGQLLGVLVCPAIRTVSQGKCRFPSSYSQALKKFLAHSERGLNKFRLSERHATEIDVLEYLRMPSLRSICTLYISIPTITNQTLNFLQRGGDTHYDAFPRFKSLTLKHCYTLDGELVSMVTSRRCWHYMHPEAKVTDTRLESIHVMFYLPVTIDQLTSQTEREIERCA